MDESIEKRFAHVYEQFHAAVMSLCQSQGNLEDRLREAYRVGLIQCAFGAGPEPRMPPEIEADFQHLEQALRVRELTASMRVPATRTRILSDGETRELLASILSMYGRVARYARPAAR